MTKCIISLAAAGLVATGASAAVTPRTPNEKVVVAFYNQAFNDHQPNAAADRHIGPIYIQHNPLVPTAPPRSTSILRISSRATRRLRSI